MAPSTYSGTQKNGFAAFYVVESIGINGHLHHQWAAEAL